MKIKSALLLLLGAFVASSQITTVFACDFYSSPWYEIHVQVKSETLPADLILEKQPKSETSGFVPVAISNPTNKPIYIVRTFEPAARKDASMLTPNSYYPYYRLQNNQVFLNMGSSATPRESDWQVKVATSKLTIDDNLMMELGEGKIENEFGDYRPENITVPFATKANFVMIADNKAFAVPVEFVPILNSDYNPTSNIDGMKSCGKMQIPSTTLPGSGLLAATLGPIIIASVVAICCVCAIGLIAIGFAIYLIKYRNKH